MPKLKLEDIDQIRELVRVAKDGGATEIVVEDSDTRISVRMPGYGAPVALSATASAPVSPAAISGAASLSASRPANWKPVISTKVGVFRASADDFAGVSAGTEFSDGQTLCFVEAMNALGEINSVGSGIIREICAEDGDFVQYGSILFYAEYFGGPEGEVR